MKVTLRDKKLKSGMRSLYLDFYPPIVVDGKETRRDFLSLYIYDKPKTELQREHNKETKILAESIRAKRQLELQANPHGFISSSRKRGDFLAFYLTVVEQKKTLSEATYCSWRSSYDHLKEFSGGQCSFAEITLDFVERYSQYLQNCEAYRTRSKKFNENLKESKIRRISPNTAKLYFSLFTSAITEACKKRFLSFNPALEAKPIKSVTPTRDFFTLDELKVLALTECKKIPDNVRRAALFSALTGLRFSDIERLTWFDVRDDDNESFLVLRIKKTGEPITHPISPEARGIIGERKETESQVFEGLKYSSNVNLQIKKWTKAAGIERRLTFHAFRHSFATGQITLGTDIFTVSKLLGHADLKTTQIYARLVDEKKRVAANKISLK